MFKDFEDFFGMGGMGGGQQGRSSKGTDILLNLEITFMESVMGIVKEINYSRKGTCSTCSGSRCKPGTSASKCSSCGGSGYINMRQGPMNIHMACSKCKGTGEIIKNPCGTCSGSGVSNAQSKETITIPKGINNGQNLRVHGKVGSIDARATTAARAARRET
jgi:molecular chaperone DnaJ